MSDVVFVLAITTLIDEISSQLEKSPEKYPLAADLAAANGYLKGHILGQTDAISQLLKVTERLFGKLATKPSLISTSQVVALAKKRSLPPPSKSVATYSALLPVARSVVEPGQLAHLSTYLTHLIDVSGYGGFPVEYLDQLVQSLTRNAPDYVQNVPISSADLWPKAVAQADEKLSKLEESVVIIDRLRKNDQKAAKLRELGNNLMLNKLYPQAIAVYTEAVEAALLVVSDETFEVGAVLQLLTNRAIAYIGLSCIVEAIDDLNLAVFVDPTFVAAWAQLGFCHLHMGHPLEAIECYELCIQSHMNEGRDNNGVSPLFVKKITELVSLCEKRAGQQGSSTLAIELAVKDYTDVLDVMRSQAIPEDMPFYEYRRENQQSVVERANRENPSILTPTILQDLHTSSFEATVVPMTIETSLVSNRAGPNTARANIREPSEVRREGNGRDLIGSFDPALNPALAAASAAANAANSANSVAEGASNQPRNNTRTTITTLGPRTTTTTHYSASYTIPGPNGNPVREILNNFGEMMERRNARANGQGVGQVNERNGEGNGQGNEGVVQGNSEQNTQQTQSRSLEASGHELPTGARTLRETLPEVAGFLGNLLFSSGGGDQSTERSGGLATNTHSGQPRGQGDASDVPDVDLD